MSDAETLAEWLGAQVESHNVTDITDEQTTWIEVGVDDLADRILASDWLAAHDAAVAARALEDAAISMPLAGKMQPYAGAQAWLSRRAAAFRAEVPR